MATANDLRRGMAINYNGDVAVVLDSQHRTPGNLRAFVQATLRSIRTGKSSDVRFSSTEKIDVVPMMTRKMDFSYKDGEDYVFSDPETYETVTLSAELVGDAKNFLVENASVTVTFVDDKAVSISVSDDGVGLPADFNPALTKRLGTRIVQALAGQLGAELTRQESTGGTHLTLVVPLHAADHS